MSKWITLGIESAPASGFVELHVFRVGVPSMLSRRVTPDEARAIAIGLRQAADVASHAKCARCGKSSLFHELQTNQCP